MAFACEICGKEFNRNHDKKEHELTHGVKKLKCDHCNKEYSNKANRYRHVRDCHQGINDKSNNTLWSICSNNLMCSECHKVYKNENVKEYMEHIEEHRKSEKFGRFL